MVDTATLRARMVDNQLRTFDVTDSRIQRAMGRIAREHFVRPEFVPIAYSDADLPLDEPPPGVPPRLMLRPMITARMIQSADIHEGDVVLVVGAGYGYSAAVVAALARRVVALESDPALAQHAKANLAGADLGSVSVIVGPLPQGCPAEAPFDVILVEGAVEDNLSALFDQLADGGRLVTIEGRGLAAQARLYSKAGDVVSGWNEFNASGPVLPGFERTPGFVF